MLKQTAVLTAIAAALAWGPSTGAQQPEELPVMLTCKPPSFKIRGPQLFLNGTCPISDGVYVKVNLSHSVELLMGGELQPSYSQAGSGTSEIENKKFEYTQTIEGPGKYVAQVAMLVDMQDKAQAAEVKKKTAHKHSWQFEFLVWGDDLVPVLSPKLTELHTLIAETRELVKKFEAAAQTETGWAAQSKPLTLEGSKFQAKLEHHELMAYYNAAVHNLFFTVRNMVNNAPYYTFSGGKFSGAKDYHADNQKVQTFRGEEFNWENLKRYIEDTLPLGGREFSLWIIKDLRRTAGQMRPEITDAVKSQKTAPGVDLWAERLSKATISDLDGLEVEIRGAKAAAKDPAPKEGDKK